MRLVRDAFLFKNYIMKTTFTTYFRISNPESVEFFDIPLDEDAEAFICPFLIANNRDIPFCDALYRQNTAFFQNLNRNYIMPNDRNNALAFLSRLHEPNEYHLGYSDSNKGKAISGGKAEEIFAALRNNRSARQGSSITNEAHNVLLLVDGIGQDIMSDVIANVCRDRFAAFTLQQCQKYSIPTSMVQFHYYDMVAGEWEFQQFQLPIYKGKPIILIPNRIIAGHRAYSNLYNWFIAKNYLADDILNNRKGQGAIDKFTTTLQDGTRKAIIKVIYKTYRKPKQDLIDFVLEYQGSLSEFLDYARDNYPELVLDTVIL